MLVFFACLGFSISFLLPFLPTTDGAYLATAVFFALLFVVTAIHEAGHAVAAQYIGARIHTIAVWGIGYDFATRRLGGRKYQKFNSFVFFTLPDPVNAVRHRGFIAAGGLAANIASALFAFGLGKVVSSKVLSVLLAMFALQSALIAFINLMPLGHDGRAVWRALKVGQANSPCLLCRWLRRYAGEDFRSFENWLWQQSYKWERLNTAPLTEQEQHMDAVDEAFAVFEADPEAGFPMVEELARQGSPWAIQLTAECYETGLGVEADLDAAMVWYRRAIKAGSWRATLRYARVLNELGYHDDCDRVLNDGVRKDYVPAYFWLAWHKQKRSPSRTTYREVKPLLEHAANKGHPMAQRTYAQYMARGRFGIRHILKGLRLFAASSSKASDEWMREKELSNPGFAPSRE